MNKQNATTVWICGTAALVILAGIWGGIRLFYINGVEMSSAFGKVGIAFLLIGMVVLCAGSFLVQKTEVPLHLLYLFLALSFGGTFLFTEPVFSVPDETSHFANAYAMSNVYTFDLHNGGLETRRMTDWHPPYSQVHVDREGFATYFASFGGQQDLTEVPWFDETRTNTSPILYAVCALGITLGRILGLPFGWLAVLGQAFNLVFFVLVTAYGVYLLPYGKRLLCAIGLLPIVLQQAASYSYDVEILAAAILVTAISFHYVYATEKKPNYLDLVLFLLSAIVLYLAKGHLYLPMLLLPPVLFIKRGWIAKEKRRYWILGFVGVLAVFVLWFFAFGGADAFVAKLFYTPYITRLDAPGHSIWHYLIHFPDTFGMILRTVWTHGRDYVFQMMGGAFGSFQIFIYTPIVYAIFGWLLICSIRREDEVIKITLWRRILVALLLLFTDSLALIAMMLYETGQNDLIIEGFQGRYMLPTLPGIMLCLFFWKKPVAKRLPEGIYPLASAWLLYVAVIDYLCKI